MKKISHPVLVCSGDPDEIEMIEAVLAYMLGITCSVSRGSEIGSAPQTTEVLMQTGEIVFVEMPPAAKGESRLFVRRSEAPVVLPVIRQFARE